jgi:hypothetical protein
MANDVFANGREISCKKADGKSTCSFPDVCMTPPENPATPPGVPIPYPNTAFASDTTAGSKSVQISGKEVMLKNKSYFKKSMGDEAGCAAKKGFITSTHRGKVYFIAWSMDVKVEGENAVRHLDMTTHNHASPLGNESVPWPYVDRMELIQVPGCEKERKKIDDECGNPLDKNKATCPNSSAVDAAKAEHEAAKAMPQETAEDCKARDKAKDVAQQKLNRAHEYYEADIQGNECTKALRCALVPYKKGDRACCPPQTPDHLVPASHFGKGRGAGTTYKERDAPCMCATGNAQTATHGLLGRGRTRYMKDNGITPNQDGEIWTVDQACDCGADSAAKVTGCTKECLKAQLKKGHEDMDIDMEQKIGTKKENVLETDEDLGALQDLMNEFPLKLG